MRSGGGVPPGKHNVRLAHTEKKAREAGQQNIMISDQPFKIFRKGTRFHLNGRTLFIHEDVEIPASGEISVPGWPHEP